MVLYDIDVRCEVRSQHSCIQRHLATDTGFLDFFVAIFIALSLVFVLAGPDAHVYPQGQKHIKRKSHSIEIVDYYGEFKANNDTSSRIYGLHVSFKLSSSVVLSNCTSSLSLSIFSCLSSRHPDAINTLHSYRHLVRKDDVIRRGDVIMQPIFGSLPCEDFLLQPMVLLLPKRQSYYFNKNGKKRRILWK